MLGALDVPARMSPSPAWFALTGTAPALVAASMLACAVAITHICWARRRRAERTADGAGNAGQEFKAADAGIARGAIERLDGDAVIALGLERSEGRALERLRIPQRGAPVERLHTLRLRSTWVDGTPVYEAGQGPRD